MKIHNATDLDLDPAELRALARGELDPVRRAIEEHKARPSQIPEPVRKPRTRKPASANLPASNPGGKTPSTINPAKEQVARQQKDKTAVEPKPDPKAIEASRREEFEALREKLKQYVQIIRACEPLEVLNYDVLALKYYPDMVDVLGAKRRRDLWFLAILFTFGLFLIGWQGLLPAWIAGSSMGISLALCAFAIPQIRALFLKVPSHRQLVQRKKEMEFRAMSHIRMLEGSNGLAYQCQMMLPYRKVLGDKRYHRIVILSRQKAIIKAMRSVAAIRLYLMYMLEAQQAFKEVKDSYMKVSSKLKTDFADFLT